MKIIRETKLKDLMENEKAIEILFESGLHCIGCGMAMYETLEQGCLAHGMNKKQIDELIKKLNNQTQGKVKRRKPEVSSQ